MYKFMLLHANFLQELRKYVLWNCAQGHLAPWFSTWNTLQYMDKNSKIFKYLKIFKYIKNYDSFNCFSPLKDYIKSRCIGQKKYQSFSAWQVIKGWKFVFVEAKI